MRTCLSLTLSLLAGIAALSPALAAEPVTAAQRAAMQERFQSKDRTYFREYRLRAYRESRAGLEQGATCATPKGVCWVAEPLSRGEPCSCADPESGPTAGVVGG